MSASTHTRRAAMPSRQNVLTRARLMTRDGGPSERRLEVVEAHEAVAVVEDDPDRVAPYAGERRALALLPEPGAGQPPDLAALARVQVVPRPVPAEPAGLDLGEHQRVAVHGDQVDLAQPRPVVAGDDAPAEPLEVLRGELLTQAAEGLAGIGRHDRR